MTEKTEELIAKLREVATGSMQGTQVIGSPIMRGGELAARAAEALEAATRERNAAVAAIERVRAEARAYAKQPDVLEPCGAAAQSILMALDPEKVAEVIAYADTALDDLPSPGSTAEALARALCEAYTEGRLS